MSGPALDVFSFRESIVKEYKHFATSFTTIHAHDIREQVEAIYAKNRYWPEPLIQINPSYKRSTNISKVVDHGILDPRCAEIFQSKGSPLSLYKHQEQAIALAAEGESFVVTTGTGSGKSLCFFIPIVNHTRPTVRSLRHQRKVTAAGGTPPARRSSHSTSPGKRPRRTPGSPNSSSMTSEGPPSATWSKKSACQKSERWK